MITAWLIKGQILTITSRNILVRKSSLTSIPSMINIFFNLDAHFLTNWFMLVQKVIPLKIVLNFNNSSPLCCNTKIILNCYHRIIASCTTLKKYWIKLFTEIILSVLEYTLFKNDRSQDWSKTKPLKHSFQIPFHCRVV